jgi:hypothetical protein
MEALKEILAMPSPYRGGTKSYETVQSELRRRFGDQVANEYRPELCRSYREWRKLSYAPKPGSKAIQVVTIIEEKDDKGKVVNKVPKVVSLFNINQVRRVQL